MGVPSLIDLFDEMNYNQLPRRHPGELRTVVQERPQAVRLPHAQGRGHRHRRERDGRGPAAAALRLLAGRGSFVNLDNYNPEYLPILSRDVLRRIAAGDSSWEKMVPVEVAELIKKRSFFGYQRSADD